jgi:hypothetical protein
VFLARVLGPERIPAFLLIDLFDDGCTGVVRRLTSGRETMEIWCLQTDTRQNINVSDSLQHKHFGVGDKVNTILGATRFVLLSPSCFLHTYSLSQIVCT